MKRIAIALGMQYDLAMRDPEYIQELVTHHVGGYLKIAPEHSEDTTLSEMMKPGISAYDESSACLNSFQRKPARSNT